MDKELLTALVVNTPSAVAVIVVVGMFLRHMASDRAREREVWSNHLSGTAAALQKIITLLEVMIQRENRKA